MEPVLMTDRLALRRFTAADTANLLALDGDPAVMQFLAAPKTRAQIEAKVLPRFLTYYERYSDFGFWAADTRRNGELSGGEFIGWFGPRPVAPAAGPMVDWPDSPEDTSVAEIGYRLRRSAWGRGYATEGTRALIGRAFAELGVDELVATTMAVNNRSRRVLEKSGLRYLRTVHLDFPDPLEGNEHGDVEYGLHRDAWQHASQAG